MQDHLCITVRFLDGAFHGRADRAEPEWPPSPLRLFQALAAAAAGHWNERGDIRRAAPALCWLEAQPAPVIVAPRATPGTKYRTYVPDNVGDLVAGRWSRGDDAAIVKRSEKDVGPTRLHGGEAVHYLWPLPEAQGEFGSLHEVLFATVSSITHLGWGVDLVVAHAATLSEKETAALPGQRWRPARNGGGTPLRVPVAGTLADLKNKHAAFLRRTENDRFAPVPPLSTFDLVGYADDTSPPPAPTAAFSLLKPDASGYRLYDPARDAMRVAGMLRHAAADPALGNSLGWDAERVRRTVLGHHGPPDDGPHVPVAGPRLAFLPLPSVESRPGRDGGRSSTIGGIRRVLVRGTDGLDPADLRALARLLSGQTLTDEASGETAAMLSRLPDSDPMVSHYTGSAATWTTVTPVILPGNDDRGKYRQRMSLRADDAHEDASAGWADWLAKLDARTDALLRRAIRHAGYAPELADRAALEWRDGGFLPGVALASHYNVPQKLRRFRRLHVRITWRDTEGRAMELPGPLCLGGGRFIGLGLFCAVKP